MSDSDQREASSGAETGAGDGSPAPAGADDAERRPLPTWKRGRAKRRKGPADEPDAFQQGMARATRDAASRWPLIVGLSVAALAAIGGVVAWSQRSHAGSVEDTRVLAEAAAYESRARIGDAEAMFGARKTPPPQPVVESEAARDELVDARLGELRSRGGRVDRNAELVRARRSLIAGEPEAALEAYEAFLAGSARTHPLYFAALEGKAIALEDAGRSDEALAMYEELAGKPGAFYRDMAMWHQGRLLEALDRSDEALAVYRSYLEEFPFTDHSLARDEVKARLEALAPELLDAPEPAP